MNETLEAAGCTDTGALRTNNEDSFQCCREQGVFVVCDGMGGAAAGEIASRMAVECVSRALCSGEDGDQRGADAIEKAMVSAIADANRKIFEESQRNAGHLGMGTTIVAAQVSGGIAHLAHVGDSRCYLWRKGRMDRTTRDHSLVGEQVRLGQLSAEEAENSPYRNVITRALGTEPTVETEYQRLEVLAGDVLLLCSDGLTRELDEERIAELVARAAEGEDVESVCQRLVESANEQGGRDNITCVLVKL